MLSEKQLLTLNNYTVSRVLGQTRFGKVYEGVEIETTKSYTLKVFDRSKTKAPPIEINLVSRLNHPSLLPIHEVLTDNECYYVITERLTNNTLLQYLSHYHHFTEQEARLIFTDIFEGIRYLHEKQEIAHLDLRLDNITIDGEFHARIIDFEAARPFTSFRNTPFKSGSHLYCSPEMLNDGPVTEQTDIWSLGVILYLLVIGEYPFCTDDEFLLTTCILYEEFPFPLSVSEGFHDLVQQMLEKDASNRITLSGIASHPWMTKTQQTTQSGVSLPSLPVLMSSVPKPVKTLRQNVINYVRPDSHTRVLAGSSPVLRYLASHLRTLAS
jgi:serine/threonine protein kinase